VFANYLTVALRNIARHKLYSAINICGLALGLTCVILIALFIRDETSFDKWVPDSANLYRLDQIYTFPGRAPIVLAASDFPLPALLKDSLPEVTGMTRFWPRHKTVTIGGRSFAQDIAEADGNFFQMIRFPLVAGDAASALSQPDSIVLSQSLARKYFGNADPMGKTLVVNKQNCPFVSIDSISSVSCANDAVVLRVTGVMRDMPHNSHMQAEAVMPHNSPADDISEFFKAHWFGANGYGYVRLAPGSDPAAVARKIPPLLDRNINVLEDLGMPLKASKAVQVRLVPFSSAHMDSEAQTGNMVPPGSPILLYGLGVIGALILLIACFNFTNLATARALLRAREIALRKCAGARRGQIIFQFLGESLLTALLALVLALSLTEMLLPAYDSFLGRPIALHYGADWPLLALILAIAVAAGLASGFYPALILSRFRPAPVLRANEAGHTGSSLLRSALVVLQFTVAIGLAIVTLVVSTQLDFMRQQSLGFRRDNILVISTFRRMTASARESFVADLGRHPGILGVAQSADIPFSGSEYIAQMRLPGHPEYLTMLKQLITPEYFRLYNMRLLEGRLLADGRGEDRIKNPLPEGNDGRNILINQTAAARFGLTPAQAVGKMVLFGPSHVTIVGVMADTRIDGARSPARAIVYLYDRADSDHISVRIAPGHVPEVLDFVDQSWRRFAPNVAIERKFLDDDFQKLYQDEGRQGRMFGIFVVIAIFIACLGLFGLAAFTAARRTREIGIRKAFGARTRDVVLLLLWQFSVPVLIANAIAWPIAWYYLRGWLQGFADHIALNPVYFVGAGLAALVIAWATILSHALRVARTNPIHALRYE
jgi:putative ABC transport system permease protein